MASLERVKSYFESMRESIISGIKEYRPIKRNRCGAVLLKLWIKTQTEATVSGDVMDGCWHSGLVQQEPSGTVLTDCGGLGVGGYRTLNFLWEQLEADIKKTISFLFFFYCLLLVHPGFVYFIVNHIELHVLDWRCSTNNVYHDTINV